LRCWALRFGLWGQRGRGEVGDRSLLGGSVRLTRDGGLWWGKVGLAMWFGLAFGGYRLAFA